MKLDKYDYVKEFGTMLSTLYGERWCMSLKARDDASRPNLSASMEVDRGMARYLFAISTLSEADEERITTGELTEYLDVTPASVTEMVTKLDDRKLVDHEKYQGVTLTDHGQKFAARIVWRYCVVSTFFDSTLDMALDEQTAFDIGHALPEDGVSNLQNHVSTPCLGLCPMTEEDGDECMG